MIRRRRRRRGRRFLRFVFFLVAFACLGDYFYATLDREIYQEEQDRAFDDRPSSDAPIAKGDAAPIARENDAPIAKENAAPLATDSTDSEPPPLRSVPQPLPEHVPGAVLGRISVPRLGIRAMVDDAVDDGTLSRAVGHLPSTPYPGQAGNVAVAGHRDTFFRELRRLEKNDEIDFETHNGKFRYRVESMMIVDPSNTSVLEPTSENTLTVVTCYPFSYIGNAPRRFVVRAREIGRVDGREAAAGER